VVEAVMGAGIKFGLSCLEIEETCSITTDPVV
jgi:hypothetical protein